MFVGQFFDRGNEYLRMSRSNESMANSYNNNNNISDNRSITTLKTFDGRIRPKTVAGGTVQPVDRQDSLMLCQQLQEQDGFDFMDQSMDLTPYLRDLRGIDDSNEDLEPVIDKQRVLECDIQTQRVDCANAPQYTDLKTMAETEKSEGRMDDTLVAVPEASGFSGVYRPLKVEAISEEVERVREIQPTTSAKREASDRFEVLYIPSTKPRKYSLKPEAEKRNPLYRLKREKNNDAVRRSRTKAKQIQRMKDEQIRQLHSQVTEFGRIVREQDEQILQLKNTIREVEEENRSLHAENSKLRNELFQAKKRVPTRTLA